jgi:hypothetical protein
MNPKTKIDTLSLIASIAALLVSAWVGWSQVQLNERVVHDMEQQAAEKEQQAAEKVVLSPNGRFATVSNFGSLPVDQVMVFGWSDDYPGKVEGGDYFFIGEIPQCSAVSIGVVEHHGQEYHFTYIQFRDSYGRTWERAEGAPPELLQQPPPSPSGSPMKLIGPQPIPHC